MENSISLSQSRKSASSEQSRRYLILVSPIAVILAGQLIVRTIGSSLGIWGWLPLILGYWIATLLIILWGTGIGGLTRWFQQSRGSRLFAFLTAAFLIAPTVFMLFPDTWRLYFPVSVWLPTILFVLVNPWVEEGYWRWLLLDAVSEKWKWVAVFYSSTMFMINHLWMAIIVIGARNPVSSAYQFIFGFFLSVVYQKTQSLRWPVGTHFLVNLLTPTVAVFLNLYIPGT